MDTLYIHADESCLGNQFQDRATPGGAAGLVEIWRDGATNNRMAIRSALDALRLLRRRCVVHFVSDSQYLVKGIKEWMPGWKRRGWKRKAGPIENLELWKQLDTVLQRHEVHPTWVRGHAGHPRNEYANDLAVKAAKEQSHSGGFVDSGFQAWLEDQREKREKYLDFYEFLPPGEADLPG